MGYNNGSGRQPYTGAVVLRLLALSICITAVSYAVTDHILVLRHPAAANSNQSAATLGSSPSELTTSADAAQVDTEAPPVEQPGEADLLNPQIPITITQYREGRVPFVIVQGGIAGTRRSALRMAVQDFVADAGARAGLNGTFFANASLRGTDNLLIGPSLCGNETQATLSPFDKRAQLVGRPLVLMAPNRTRIVPYDPATQDDESSMRTELPTITDAFLGGVWLVHEGVAVTRDDVDRFNVHDAQDPRRRAFFTLSNAGVPGLGATTYVATSTQLARALAKAGIREAVLLDSGFSTSLVADGKTLVTGHTAPGIPSRPVPHAIVLFDAKSLPATGKIAATSMQLPPARA